MLQYEIHSALPLNKTAQQKFLTLYKIAQRVAQRSAQRVTQ